jgi:hypothetical protein
VGPDGGAAPFHFLDDIRVSFMDNPPDVGNRFPSPITKVRDKVVDLRIGFH